jgi:hypothetical protein
MAGTRAGMTTPHLKLLQAFIKRASHIHEMGDLTATRMDLGYGEYAWSVDAHSPDDRARLSLFEELLRDVMRDMDNGRGAFAEASSSDLLNCWLEYLRYAGAECVDEQEPPVAVLAEGFRLMTRQTMAFIALRSAERIDALRSVEAQSDQAKC